MWLAIEIATPYGTGATKSIELQDGHESLPPASERLALDVTVLIISSIQAEESTFRDQLLPGISRSNGHLMLLILLMGKSGLYVGHLGG